MSKCTDSKRILKVTVKRMVDTDPDTSWLGEYSDSRKTEFDIDRAHSQDCDTIRHDAEETKHVSACKYLGNDAWDCGHIDNSDSEEQCDCHVCAIPAECACVGENWNRREYRYFNASFNYVGKDGKLSDGLTPEEVHKYVRQDYERMEALNAGQWCFIGVNAEAEVWNPKTKIVQHISSSGLWGIESDGGAGHIEEEEKGQLCELRTELLAYGFTSRGISKAFKNVEHRDA